MSGYEVRNFAVSMGLLFSAAMSAPVLAQVENNPGYDRPGLGFTPAVLQAGDVMLEQGLPDWSRSDGVSLYNANTLIRAGVGQSLELQLGTGWNWLDAPDGQMDGRTDTALALKFAPAATGDLSWGLLGSVEFTDGSEEFRAEKKQYLLGASLNWQRNEDHALGLYLEAGQGDSDYQLVAVNSGWALTPALGIYAELAAQHEDETGSGTQGGAGLTWQVTPRVQLDISARHRLGGHVDTWQGGIGASIYLGD